MALKTYSYKGRQRGRKVKGLVSAETTAKARAELRTQHIREVKLRESGENTKFTMQKEITWGPFGSIPQKDIMVFSKKLATMIRSGLPVVDAMSLAHGQTSNGNMKRVVGEIIARLNAGSSLVDAFGQHDRHFDNMYRNMVQAGEVSGNLDVFLDRLVETLEKQQKIRSGIRSALFYPITLVVTALGITTFMLLNVVPTFQEMYAALDAELPAATQTIIDAADWLREGYNLLTIIGVLFGIWFADFLLNRIARPYRKFKNSLVLKLPLFGDLIIKAVVARMSLLISNLWSAGIPIVDNLRVSGSVTENLVFVDAMDEIGRRVTTGVPLSALFAEQKVFPEALSQLIAVGERTGNVDEMLGSVARYYEEEFDAVVKGLTTIIEPLMIVFVGGLIGVMVIALYLPMFSIGEAIK